MANSDDNMSWLQLAIGASGLLLALLVCSGYLLWCGAEKLVIKEVGIDGDVTLRGPGGDILESSRGGHFDEYPITIELELATTYGGDPSHTEGGDIFVHPEQNCELVDPLHCREGDCRAAIRVTGPGLCAYRMQLESRRGGGVWSCWDRIFARTPQQYESFKKQWKGKDGGRYIQGVEAEAHERCDAAPTEDERGPQDSSS